MKQVVSLADKNISIH